MSNLSVTSNVLGLENPQHPHGIARLILCALLLASALVRIAVGHGSVVELVVVAWVVLTGVGAAFAWNLLVGLRAWLSFVVDAGVPVGVRSADRTIPRLLLDNTIEGTYSRPTKLIELLVYKFLPEFAFLTPPHRRPASGWGATVVGILGFVVAAWATGWISLLVLLVVGLSVGARAAALALARSRVPSTEYVYEVQTHVGDKGDPVGLHNELRRACEGFRVDRFQNRYLVESRPRVAEYVADANVSSEILTETQPLPVGNTATPRNALVLDVAGVVLGWTGWTMLLFASLAGVNQPHVWGVVLVAGALTRLSGECFSMAFAIHNTFRFRSDVYWVKYDGSYNTTTVGSRGQRTSFQSDLHLYLYGARIVTECTMPSDSLTGSTLAGDAALRQPRYVVTVEQDELFASRLQAIQRTVDEYQDEGSSARPTDLSSAEYQQHLTRIQVETALVEQARIAAANAAAAIGNAQPVPPAIAGVNPATPALPQPTTANVAPPTQPAPARVSPPSPAASIPPTASPPASASPAGTGANASPRPRGAKRPPFTTTLTPPPPPPS